VRDAESGSYVSNLKLAKSPGLKVFNVDYPDTHKHDHILSKKAYERFSGIWLKQEVK